MPPTPPTPPPTWRPGARLGALLALLVLLPCFIACEHKQVSVRIDDFEAKAVEGVRFWRLDDVTGSFVADGHVVFAEINGNEEGDEWVSYHAVAPDGTPGAPIGAPIYRIPGAPSAVTMDLYYLASGPGWYRITTFNASGESELSDEQILL